MRNRRLAILLVVVLVFQMFAGVIGTAVALDEPGARAEAFDAQIDALDYSALSFADDVSVTRAVYDGLPEEEKPFITRYDGLLMAEAAVAANIAAAQEAAELNAAALEAATVGVVAAEAAASELVLDGTDTEEDISVVEAVYGSASAMVVVLSSSEDKTSLENRLVEVRNILEEARSLLTRTPFSFRFGLFSEDDGPSDPIEMGSVTETNNNTILNLSSGYLFEKVVLGLERTIDVSMKNTSGAYMFNVGVEMVLEDGIEVISPSPSSIVVDEFTGVQTAYWKDIKNLQAGEEYVFPVTIGSLNNYRVAKLINIGEIDEEMITEVPFGTVIPIEVNIYHSPAARTISGPPVVNAKVSATMNWTIVPFTITPSHAPEVVKGAGEDATEVDEWGEFGFSFEIVNNARYGTEFSSIHSAVNGSVQLYELSDGGVVGQNYESNERSFAWTNLIVGVDASKTLELKGAFLNKTMIDDENGDNQGSFIRDGFRANGELNYAATSLGGGSYDGASTGSLDYDMAVAKDIVIHKSVSPSSDIGYGTELTYTLTVKTNEYYEVENVVITDTIGDGQTLVSGSFVTPGDFTLDNSSSNGDGTWSVTWSVYGDALAQEQVRTFEYRTIVNTNWSPDGDFNGDPIYAGDHISNDVDVHGETVVSGTVSDHSSTSVWIKEPGISEVITKRNLEDLEEDVIEATVGDSIEFTVSYDASTVTAKQHAVEIRDYLPLGTTLDANVDVDGVVDSFQMYGVFPKYDAATHMLYWEYDELPSNHTMSVVVKVIVEDDELYVTQDKADKNLVTLSYENSPGIIKSKRDQVEVLFTEPELEVTRTVSNDNVSYSLDIEVNGEETAWVKLVIKNVGETAANNVVLTDVLPAQFTGGVIYPVGGDFTYDTGVFTLTEPIAAGASYTIIYSTTIIENIGAGKEIYQSSSITYYSRLGELGREYTHAGDTSHITMSVPQPTISYEVVHYGTTNHPALTKTEVSDNNFTAIRVGDWVLYKVVVDVPTNDVAYNPELKITLPDNHTLDEVFGSDYNDATFTGTTVSNLNYSNVAGVVTLNSVLLETAGADHIFYMRTIVDGAQLVATIGNDNEETQESSASFKWRDVSGAGVERTINSSEDEVTVRTPQLSGVWYYENGAASSSMMMRTQCHLVKVMRLYCNLELPIMVRIQHMTLCPY